MLRIHTSTNAGAVQQYYTNGLTKEDYYTEKGDIIGNWYGKGAEKLGLKGSVEQSEFEALINNTHPITGDKLTPRNTTNRRIGYDINFHAPKSVSIVYSLTQDTEILEAFRTSVQETMQNIEQYAQTSVRKNGAKELRNTGNITYSEFVHFTARPVDGKPDPHLHAHCFTFNNTFDEKEGKFKALQNEGIKKNAPYFEAYFHNSFANKLEGLGYNIERGKKSWEIKNISKTAIKEFSRRTNEIEKTAKEKGIDNAKQKAELGAKTRQKKESNLSWNEMLLDWQKRLPEEDKNTLQNLKNNTLPQKEKTAERIVKETIIDGFEKKSLIEQNRFKAMALKKNIGSHSSEAIEKAIAECGLIEKHDKGKDYFTTKQVQAEQQKMIETATKGKGLFRPLNTDYSIKTDYLNEQQKDAIKHIHQSKDLVTIVQGGAGVGKTTLMKEAVQGIEENGKTVFAFAPSTQASKGVMREEGFSNADTVSRLLVDKKLQTKCKDNVIWIDEAGMVGTRTMSKVLDIAKKQNARILLTGDTKQHSSVERGDAMRLLQEKAKIKSPRVSEILRQKGEYKKAVSHISDGEITKGFKQLNKLGAIKEVKEEIRYEQLAEDYTHFSGANKKVLVVAPTHKEGAVVTEHIRENLRKNGLLAKRKKNVTIFENLQLSETEKQDTRFLEAGLMLQTNQNIKGFKRGGKYELTGNMADNHIELKNEKGELQYLNTSNAKRYDLFKKSEIELSKGDKIRITKNGFGYGANISKRRVDNGNIHTVEHISSKGEIHLKNGTRLSNNFGHLTYGYAVTSHSSQGKTVNTVLVAQSSKSFNASNAKQFYVSVSRGKEQVKIYTDDKNALLKAIKKDTKRTASIEAKDKKTTKRQKLNNRLSIVKTIYNSSKEGIARKYKDFKTKRNLRNGKQPIKPIKPIIKGR